MYFNKTVLSWGVLAVFVFLHGCASKQLNDDITLTPSQLNVQQDTRAFEEVLTSIQSEKASEKTLLEAKVLLDRLYQRDPRYVGALINSANISYRLGHVDDAKEHYVLALTYLESLTSKPQSSAHFLVHIYHQLGLIMREQGQFKQAENYYRQALTLEPDNPKVIKNLAILLDLYRGKLPDALVFYQQYQALVGESEPRLEDWIYDLKNRLPQEVTAHE